MSNDQAIVTGASSGIGEATAQRLSEEGYTVHLAARRVDRMEHIADRLNENEGRAEVHELDLQSDSSIEQFTRVFEQRDTAPGILINNAGYGIYGPVEEIPLEAAREMFETNFMGTMKLTKLAIKWMKRQGGGRIVNVTSGVAKRGFPIMNYYSASKAALESMSESMKLELAPDNITVQVVYPLRTETGFSAAAQRFVPDDFQFPSHGPTQSADEVAKAIVSGLRSTRFRIHPHYSSKFLGTLNEWFPGFVEWVTGLRELVKKARE